jgi:hypothetical protein
MLVASFCNASALQGRAASAAGGSRRNGENKEAGPAMVAIKMTENQNGLIPSMIALRTRSGEA